LIGSVLLGSALVAGYFLSPYINETATKWAAFTLFMMIGLFKLITWYMSRGKIVKQNRIITFKEAFVLALILSLDGIGVAFGIGLERITFLFIVIIILVSLITDILLFKLGHILGSTLAGRFRRDIGWIGGVLLIIIAIVQLFI